MNLINSKKTPLTFDTIEPGTGLAAALTKSRADIIGEVAASNLRGRGGAGFPTGTKWNLAAAAGVREGGAKYVVCNADEGEPGTFKDRVLLTDYADLVFEGMTIAARAIGATRGILYLRGEYVYLRPHLIGVLERRRQAGQLGADILGTPGFTFDIEIRMGAGAYVCGEETALIESLEGHRGEPRNRPPFPVNTGFMGQPTVVNNVETLASVTAILSKGAAWFKAFGTEKHEADKFSRAGYHLFRTNMKVTAALSSLPPLMEFLGGIGMAVALWYGSREIASGALTIGQLTSFIATLFARQNDSDFAKLFDDTLFDIAKLNNDTFAVKTDGGAKVRLFDRISRFILFFGIDFNPL
jgi:[NiFe] hydrogenase diaphorase moiety large subunit